MNTSCSKRLLLERADCMTCAENVRARTRGHHTSAVPPSLVTPWRSLNVAAAAARITGAIEGPPSLPHTTGGPRTRSSQGAAQCQPQPWDLIGSHSSVSASTGYVVGHAALWPPALHWSHQHASSPGGCIGATHHTHELPPCPHARSEALAGHRMCANSYHTVARAPHHWEPHADDATGCLSAAIRFCCMRAPPTPPSFFVRSRGLPPVCRGLVLCLPHPRSVPTWSTSRCAAPPRSGTASSRTPLHTFVIFCDLPPPFCVLALPLFPPFRGCPVGQHVTPRRLPHAQSSPPTCL